MRQAEPSTLSTTTPSFESQEIPFHDNRSWALWCLREFKRLGMTCVIAPQARCFVAHGFVDENDIAGLLDELLGRTMHKPTPIPRQLDLLDSEAL